jgi:hypothetical protein
MQKPSNILFALALLGAVLQTGSAVGSTEKPGDLLIVANNTVKDASLRVEDVRAFFFKQRAAWPSGERVTPFHAKAGSEARKVFLEKVMQMTSDEESRHWEKQKIIHGTSGPTEFASVQRAVFAIKGSVSYVLRKDYTDKVSKILLVIPE